MSRTPTTDPRGDERTESTSVLLTSTRYRSRAHGKGVNSWVYEYENTSPLGKTWIGGGLEIGVQLRGTWNIGSRFHEARAHRAGEICRLSVGERYAHTYEGRLDPGLQVGFIVCDADLSDLNGELRFVGDSGLVNPAFTEFSAAFVNDASIGDEQTIAAVNDYVRRHCELVPSTPLLVCKRELERWFANDLSVEHIASLGGLHPATFVRRFKAAYGLTPVAYRVMFRANYASRLLWLRPDLSIAQIAEECGFPNVSYFHRTFQRCFGMRASVARARLVA